MVDPSQAASRVIQKRASSRLYIWGRCVWRNETAWSKRHTRPTLRGEAGPSRRQDPASPARKEQHEMKLNIRNRDEAERSRTSASTSPPRNPISSWRPCDEEDACAGPQGHEGEELGDPRELQGASRRLRALRREGARDDRHGRGGVAGKSRGPDEKVPWANGKVAWTNEKVFGAKRGLVSW